MKLPGKRDRLRKATSSQEAALPAGGAAAAPDAATPAPAAEPTPAPEPAPASAEPAAAPGPLHALFGTAGGRIALGFVAAAIVFHAVTPDRPPASPSAPSPVPSAPQATEAAPAFDPLLVLDDEPPPPEPRPLAERQPGPVPADAPALQGDGALALVEALALARPAPLPVQRELNRLGLNPDADATPAALAWARGAEAALAALERAARSERLEAASVAGVTSSLDVRALHDLGVASLCVGRFSARGGAPAEGAAPALDLLRLGEALARADEPTWAAAGLALSRLGQRWLLRSLERDRWSDDELAWAQARVEAARASCAEPRASASDDAPAAALARARSEARAGLDALALRCADRRRGVSTSTTTSAATHEAGGTR